MTRSRTELQVCLNRGDGCCHQTQGGGWEVTCQPQLWGHPVQLHICQDITLNMFRYIISLLVPATVIHFLDIYHFRVIKKKSMMEGNTALSAEVLEQIFLHLSYEDLASLLLACR